MLNKNEIQQLAHLQVQICTADERLAYLKVAIDRLVSNKCHLSLQIQIHDDDQHELNLQEKKAKEVINEDSYFGGIAMMAGLVPKPPALKQPACTFQFSDKMQEGFAIRILNVMYEHIKAQRHEYLQEMKRLLIGKYGITGESFTLTKG